MKVYCESCGSNNSDFFLAVRNDVARKAFPTVVFREKHENLICRECLRKVRES